MRSYNALKLICLLGAAVYFALEVYFSLSTGIAPSFSIRPQFIAAVSIETNPSAFWFGITMYSLFGLLCVFLAYRLRRCS